MLPILTDAQLTVLTMIILTSLCAYALWFYRTLQAYEPSEHERWLHYRQQAAPAGSGGNQQNRRATQDDGWWKVETEVAWAGRS